jgi:hypothetical protein
MRIEGVGAVMEDSFPQRRKMGKSVFNQTLCLHPQASFYLPILPVVETKASKKMVSDWNGVIGLLKWAPFVEFACEVGLLVLEP